MAQPALQEAPSDQDVKLSGLEEQHRIMDVRTTELDRRPWLSPDEQVELARLKKVKLRLKDEIRNLSSGVSRF